MARPVVDPIAEASVRVRLVTAHYGGVVTGADVFSLEHFGGVLPIVGDTFVRIRTADDYDVGVVQRRYFITQPDQRVHWSLAMRDAPPAPALTGIVANALAVSDYLRAVEARRPMREVVVKLRKCNGEHDR